MKLDAITKKVKVDREEKRSKDRDIWLCNIKSWGDDEEPTTNNEKQQSLKE